MAGDSDSADPLSSSNSNKRLKLITSSNNYNPEPSTSINDQLESQEKEKSSKSMEESYFLSCGICLMEEGKSIRGQIDSCYHYFCFVCIMEWSKIESRCPMCKRRFTTIRRPRKEGVFPYERIVNVPQSDQVYYHFGNASVGPADPYSHVQCSVCHGTSDDSLLLLCDLCDVAAHTYCVGLGYTVPEGDWFCHDCVFLRAEHNNAETDSGDENQNIFGLSGGKHDKIGSEKNGGSQSVVENFESDHFITDIYEVVPPANANISICDIVHEESDRALIWRSRPRVSSSLSLVSEAGVSVVEEATISDRRTSQNSAGNRTESGARTLHRCRNVRSRIQALRENWRALQNGSLSFASCTVESGSSISKRHNGSELLHNRSSQQYSSISQSCQQLRAQDDPSWDILHSNDRSSHDIDKAWKMMEFARLVQQNCERNSSIHLTSESRHPSMKGKASQQVTNTSASLHIVNRNQRGNNVLSITDTEKQRKSFSLESKVENQRSRESRSQKLFKVMTVKSCEGLTTTHLSQLFDSSSPRSAQTRCVVDNVKGINMLYNSTHQASSSVSQEQGSYSFSINLIGSVPGTKSSSCQRELSTFTFTKADNSKGKDELGKGCAKSKMGKDDDAKSEIQALVKLNLKLLSRHKQLGFDAFKEIARCATHTILAACGLEHSKFAIRFFPSSLGCSHTEHLQQIHKSNLANSCRECFYVFVQDVVQSIMYEKLEKPH